MEERLGQDHQMLGLFGQGEGEGRTAWPGLARIGRVGRGQGLTARLWLGGLWVDGREVSEGWLPGGRS